MRLPIWDVLEFQLEYEIVEKINYDAYVWSFLLSQAKIVTESSSTSHEHIL